MDAAMIDLKSIRLNSLVMASLFKRDQLVRMNFHGADLATLLAIIYMLINRNQNKVIDIHSFLRDRGGQYDLATIKFLLDAFEGPDNDVHLWWMWRYNRYVTHRA
jgi:hypothetical protein